MRKQYQLGFDPYALLLFLLIMLPNFYWFAVPAPQDVLRSPSSTAALDAVASGCQILFLAALICIRRRGANKLRCNWWIGGVLLCTLVYLAAWFAYYRGTTSPTVILSLCMAPCISFFCYAADRKNIPALLPLAGFTICHLLSSVFHFLR